MKPSHLDILGLWVPLTLLILWQMVSLIKGSPLFPGPYEVAVAAVKNWGAITGQLGITLIRAVAGFALALVTMVPLGIALGRFHVIGKLFEPLINMIATLPPPAVIPLVMLFAGTGDAAKIVIIAYAAAVPLLINTYEASNSLHPVLNRVGKSLRLSKLETMLLVDLPTSLPMIASGARLAIASSLLVSVTSEMLLATNGIGVFLQRSQEYFKIDAGLAGIAAISLVGLIINSLAFWLEKRWLFWHYRGS